MYNDVYGFISAYEHATDQHDAYESPSHRLCYRAILCFQPFNRCGVSSNLIL